MVAFAFIAATKYRMMKNRMQRYNKNLGYANFRAQKASFSNTPDLMEGLER